MPHLTLPLTPIGCELDVYVGVSGPREAALRKAGMQVPPLEKIRMIVDTGASATAIDETVVKRLGLTPTGSTLILTPSTRGVPLSCPTYDITLSVFHSKSSLLHTILPVFASDFTGQGIQGLLGCDVLQTCLFIHDGVNGRFTLAF